MRYLIVVIAVLGWFGLTSLPAQACSCFPVGPPCQAYGSASAVFTGTAVSMRRAGPGEPKAGYGERVFKFSVDQAYLGVATTEIEIHTGGSGADCGYTFTIGERYVVYAHRYNNRLATGSCTRTRPFAQAREDLEFLGNLPSAPSRASIQGKVLRGEYPKKDPSPLPANVVVTIEGNNVRRQVRLDKEGRFQLNGVSPGKYKVRLLLPANLITQTPEQEITVGDRGCGAAVFWVTDNGRLSGRVVDIQGQPIPRIFLSLIDPSDDNKDPAKAVRSDNQGRFSFTAVPAGRYLIAVNVLRFPDPKDPTLAFPPAYYPGVVDQLNASVIAIGTGEKRTGLDIRMPRARPASGLTIEVVWDDGSPVGNAHLSLSDGTGERDTAFGATADKRGRFTMNGYVGQQVIVEARSNERVEKARITLDQPRKTLRVVIPRLR